MHILTVHHYIHHHMLHVAHHHDDWTWFRIWFAIATVTASIILNLGIFALLVSTHMALDIIKYRTKYKLGWHWTIVETVRESLVDVFFIALGLLLSLIFHHAFAIGGLGRLAQLQRLMLILVLRIGPRLKIAQHLLEVVMYWKHHFVHLFVPHAPLSRGEKGLCAMTILIMLTIVTTPYTTSLTWEDVAGTMQYELRPRLELNITHTMAELKN